MAKILVVEDEEFFREAICDLLKDYNHTVFEAENGKMAVDIINLHNFDLVISDIQMPKMTGTELLKWSNQNKPIPFILMTGFSMLLETKSAYELGAKEFITKPFKPNELLKLIDKIIVEKQSAVEPVEIQKITYCKVSIEEFVARPKTDFDIFVKVSDQKYIKVANKGEVLETNRLMQYRQKGVKYLFISNEDFQKLIETNLNIGKLIQNRSDISKEKKINFMKYTGEVILEKAFVDVIEKESLKEAQDYVMMTMNVITDDDAYLGLLSLLSNHSEQIYAHSLAVSIFSVMIAKSIGYESNLALSKISLAAFFHDIGKKELNPALLVKPRHLMSSQERVEYESHAVRGRDIMSSIKGTPDEVVQIVYEHHEDPTGQGYPLGKAKKVIHPLARIVHCANIFVETALVSPTNKGMPGREAVLYIEKVYGEQLDLASLEGLKQIYRID